MGMGAVSFNFGDIVPIGLAGVALLAGPAVDGHPDNAFIMGYLSHLTAVAGVFIPARPHFNGYGQGDGFSNGSLKPCAKKTGLLKPQSQPLF